MIQGKQYSRTETELRVNLHFLAHKLASRGGQSAPKVSIDDAIQIGRQNFQKTRAHLSSQRRWNALTLTICSWRHDKALGGRALAALNRTEPPKIGKGSAVLPHDKM